MALTDQQRAELEKLGVRLVVMRLDASGNGPGALVFGFKDLLRGDAEGWLIEKAQDDERRQAETLRLARLASEQQIAATRWAKIAGWAAIIAAALGGVPLLQWLFAK